MDKLSKNLFETFENVGNGGEEKQQNNDTGKKESMKVVLRVKPFTDKDRKSQENRGCVLLKENGKVELKAPQDSFQFKSSIRGLTDQTHEFSFSRVFNDTTQQKDLFDEIMLPFVKDILDGQNGLVFTYGVTNSGKTYTIQGTPKDGGILPRALDVVFNSISKKLYTRPNLKPKHHQDIVALTREEEIREELLRNAVLNATDKENVNMTKLLNSTTKSANSSAGSTNSTMLSDISMIQTSKQSIIDDAELAEELRARITDATTIDVDQQGNVKFGVWVSFMEIYNEMVYDLLDLTPIGKGRKRTSLKLGEDKNGKPYVKGLKTIFVTSSNEAYKVLRLGQNNRHMASTKLNQQSSRSHCIFDIKLLKIVDVGQPHVARISRLSIVDLAGSERYCKTGAEGDLLKQAGNINASIMTLGKCISTLRYNQEHPNHQTIIPFRESKLTRLFQNFFLGKGKASMIVNISQCASVFDETYHVLKFSAIAKQIKMKAERATEFWKAPPLPKVAATPSNKRPPLTIVTPATSKKRTLEKPTDFNYNELVNIVGELREKVKKERLEKANMEGTLRKEICEEMNELIVDIESSHSDELSTQRQQMEDLMDKRIGLLTKIANKRKRKNEESVDLSEISITLDAEKIKVKERDDLILTLQSRVRELEAEQNFMKVSRSPEDRCKKIELLADDLNQTKETLALQNEGIERMQNMLQTKDDEIDKLRDALDEDETTPNQLLTEMQELLESTTKELDVARVKLDNRDIRIKELESIVESQKADNMELIKMVEKTKEWYTLQLEKNKVLQSTNETLQQQVSELEDTVKNTENKLDEKVTGFKETDDLLKTVQFENDELAIKVETYESAMKEHQNVLMDNESFIEQLNAEVAELKKKLREYENKEASTEKVVVKEERDDESVRLKEDLDKAEVKVKEYGEKVERLEKQVQCFEGLQVNRTPAGKLKNSEALPSPFSKGQTPIKKLNLTPKGSPYSPASKGSNMQTIKNLQKLLDDTSKALEKKTSMVVQKTNRVQHLESQVTALEKKTSVKELKARATDLESSVNTLQLELTEMTQKKSEFEFKLVNEEENLLGLQSEISQLTEKCAELQTKLESAVSEKEFSEKRHENEMRHHCVLLSEANGKSEASSRRIDELGHQVDRADKMIEELTKTLDSVKTAECKANEETIDLRSRLDSKTIELKEAEEKILAHTNTIQNLTYDKEQVKDSRATLQKQLEDRRKSRLHVNDQLSSTVEGYEQRINHLHDTVNELEEEKSLYEEKITELTNELSTLQTEFDRMPNEVEEMKSKEHEFLEKIRTFEESCSKLEIQLQTTNAKNTKLEMKVTAMESLSHTSSKKLSVVETENEELLEKVKRLSENFKEVSKEKLDLEQAKQKVENESERQFRTILSLEKQKSESEAIISSYKDNVSDISSMKDKIAHLEKTVQTKDQEVAIYKSESESRAAEIDTREAEKSSSISDTQKENIELKESLKLSELELKRAMEEKKFALDELLKQSVVKHKRKHVVQSEILENDSPLSDVNDADYITPKRTKKESRKPTFRRLTRSTRKTTPLVQTTIVEDLNSSDENSVAEKPVNQKDVKVVVKDEPDYGNTTCDTTTTTSRMEEDEDDEYVCSVSIALSPLAPYNEEEEEEDDEIKQELADEDEEAEEDQDVDNFIDVQVGQYVALSELESYDTLPIIGKITDVRLKHITCEMMRGGYSKQWKADVTDSGDVVTMEVHRSKILWNHVRFTNSKRLPIDTKRQLQKLYLELY